MAELQTWYEQFQEACDLAVFFEDDVRSGVVHLSIGDGMISVDKQSLGITLKVESDDLVRTIYESMMSASLHTPYSTLFEALASFEEISIEASNQMDTGDVSGNSSDDGGYAYDDDDEGEKREGDGKEARWIEEHNMKKVSECVCECVLLSRMTPIDGQEYRYI